VWKNKRHRENKTKNKLENEKDKQNALKVNKKMNYDNISYSIFSLQHILGFLFCSYGKKVKVN
jgi:hypothetical protein